MEMIQPGTKVEVFTDQKGEITFVRECGAGWDVGIRWEMVVAP